MCAMLLERLGGALLKNMPRHRLSDPAEAASGLLTQRPAGEAKKLQSEGGQMGPGRPSRLLVASFVVIRPGLDSWPCWRGDGPANRVIKNPPGEAEAEGGAAGARPGSTGWPLFRLCGTGRNMSVGFAKRLR